MAGSREVTTGKVAARRRRPGEPSHVVALGGSAGGLEAFEQYFASTAIDTGMAFVLVTHLDPDHKALLPELIQRTTAMPVRQIEDGMVLAADAVHVIPPGATLTLEGGVLRVGAASPRRGARTPIDAFFRSLAAARGPTAIGVVLSGMGADGAAGLRAIKEAGGLTLVQDPDSAAFEPMPLAAIAAVAVDVIAPPDLLPGRIAALIAPPTTAATPAEAAITAAGLRRVLELLHQRTGHDLREYKPSAIERRLERRLAVHRLPTLDAYADYLGQNPEEAGLLFRELLIGVTHFFRDDEVFAVLADPALPALLASRRMPHTLRCWVAGCSTGEEAYSLAIVVHEVLARLGAHEVALQIYATDIDPAAIATARAGRYGDDIASHVSPERLARHFVREDRGYRVGKELRDTVVFALHDLVTDPPFTHLDVLCCRNVLIYLQPVLQQRLLSRFHYALAPGGLLVLGVAESLAAATDQFAPVDPKAKVFRSLDVGPARRRIDLPVTVRPDPTATARTSGERSVLDAARRAIVDVVAPPTVVINERGDVLYSSRRTGRYLEPAVGKANINIFAMAREGLGPHLTLAVRQALARRRRVTCAGLELGAGRDRIRVDLSVVPLDEPAALRGLLLVVFQEVPAPARGRTGRKARTPKAAPAALERELTRTRGQLQAMVRETAAAQAQGEATTELQGANEELQSANEELTTSKEELQSLNEELLTLNSELEAKNDELATANDDLRNLLDSSQIPTLFLDRELRVRRFTAEATRIAHLIPGDVGRTITDLTFELDYRGLARDVAEVLETLTSKEVQVTGTAGASYTMRIHPYRTMDNRVDGVVITFSDVTALRRAEQVLSTRTHDGVIARLLDRWPGMVWVRDLAGASDIYLNDRARTRWRAAGGQGGFEGLLHAEAAAEAAGWMARLTALPDGEVITRQVRLRGADGRYQRFVARESVLARSDAGVPVRVLSIIEDELPERT